MTASGLRHERIAAALLGAHVLCAAAAIAAPTDGDWPMPGHDYANTRYSPLGQIDATNAKQLQLAFTISTGVVRGHEAAPLIVGDTLYLVTPFPNVLYAFDLTRPGAPVKWKVGPRPAPSAQGVACCDVVNRGATYADGKIFFNTLDASTLAIDARSGRQLWRTSLGHPAEGETITMAPLVVRDKVLVGNSGGEYGVRGWLTALDVATGHIVWRAWSTGPDADVLIGPAFNPYYASDRGKDLGVTTWPPERWKTGGGNVWGFLSYDPQADLIFHGTANPGPWNPEQRAGDNKWTSGIFARDPKTGQARWFYQFSPHDRHDYDGINENILIDLTLDGQARKVLVHPDRNGYVYVIDRMHGEVLSATPFVPITTSTGVDLRSGRLAYAPDKEPREGRLVSEICPASPGGKDWQPAAWSPRTRLVYIPHQNLCQDATTERVSHISGTPFVGATLKMYPGPGGNRGFFTAWDPAKATAVWRIVERFPVWSGALATAGDVVFYGTMEGWFKCIDARTGTLLWQFKTGSGIVSQPVSYRGPDGRQYVAVLAGVGGWAGAVVAGDLDTRDATAAGGFAGAMRDLSRYTGKGGALYVFALP